MPRSTAFDDTDLLDASDDVLWPDGCDAVSIRDLETALGLKAPSLYRRVHSRAHADGRTVPGTDPDPPAVAPLLAFEGLRVLARAGRPGARQGRRPAPRGVRSGASRELRAGSSRASRPHRRPCADESDGTDPKHPRGEPAMSDDQPAPGRTVMIEFDSEEALSGRWELPEYRSLADCRHAGTTTRAVYFLHAPPVRG